MFLLSREMGQLLFIDSSWAKGIFKNEFFKVFKLFISIFGFFVFIRLVKKYRKVGSTRYETFGIGSSRIISRTQKNRLLDLIKNLNYSRSLKIVQHLQIKWFEINTFKVESASIKAS